MELVPQFNESAEHRTEIPEPTAPTAGEELAHELAMFRHPSAVSLVEKIDYLYETAQKVAAIVDQITPAQIQQANTMVNGPLGALFTKLLGH